MVSVGHAKPQPPIECSWALALGVTQVHQYNPAKSPKPREWLALDELTRLDLISQFHEDHGEFGESIEAHSGIHATVETQLAMDIPNIRSALGKLRKSGLTRHDAIHAIGAVLAEHIHEIMTNQDLDADEANLQYYDKLKTLMR